jgi:hypothetical protein
LPSGSVSRPVTEPAPKAPDRPKDGGDPSKQLEEHQEPWIPAAEEPADQAKLPGLGDVFALAVLGNQRRVDVVTQLVVERRSDEQAARRFEPQQPRRRSLQQVVDQDLDPRRPSPPGAVVEPEAGADRHPPLSGDRLAPAVPPRKARGIAEDHPLQPGEIVGRNFREEGFNGRPDIERRPVGAVELPDLNRPAASRPLRRQLAR